MSVAVQLVWSIQSEDGVLPNCVYGGWVDVGSKLDEVLAEAIPGSVSINIESEAGVKLKLAEI